MPSCRPDVIPAILYKVIEMRPRSIIDIGVGHGKWGLLCREYLRYWTGINAKIAGIEIYGGDETPAYSLYDEMFRETNVISVLDKFGDCELVLAVDVIEHLERRDGEKLLKAVKNRYIVSTPGYWSAQGTCFGNEHEQHKSSWSESDFENSKIVVDIVGRPHIVGWK